MGNSNKPSFFDPLLRLEQKIVEAHQSNQIIRNRVMLHRAVHLKELEDTLSDLNAALIEIKQLVAKVRKIERLARNS